MLRPMVVLLSIVLVFGCKTPLDCNYAGQCIAGQCVCETGWTGAECAELNLGASFLPGEGGLYPDPKNSTQNVLNTWGAQAILGDDGTYHMFVAALSETCPLQQWLSNGIIAHATSDKPEGPYTVTDIPLGITHDGLWDHSTKLNPVVTRTPNGTYLLYYMGSEAVNDTAINCTTYTGPFSLGCDQDRPAKATCNQQIGLAFSDSPYGPWTKIDGPILGPGPDGAWDDLFVTNPSVYIYPNGSALMVYKARSKAESDVMKNGVAFAQHWAGPYERVLPSVPIVNPSQCEDPGLYYSHTMQVFRMLYHCGCSYQAMWSLDGLNWNSSTPTQPWCNVTFTDGSHTVFTRRERPQWLLANDGTPNILFTAVANTTMTGRTWTLATQMK